MNGFYISVSNGLLMGNHHERMGEAVWEFMWFLDKMTSVSESGVGLVLGGKPIKFEEVNEDLEALTERSYRRHISILKKEGYIKVKRTPYGLIISIMKAKKMFNKKTERYAKNGVSEANFSNNEAENKKERCAKNGREMCQKWPNRCAKNGLSNIYDNISIDNTKDITNTNVLVATDVAEKNIYEGKQFNEMINQFKEVNPEYEKLFGNKTERRALKEMIDKYGFEKMQRLLNNLPGIIIKPYAPRITTPLELQKKMGQLVIFLKQNQTNQEIKNKSAHFEEQIL